MHRDDVQERVTVEHFIHEEDGLEMAEWAMVAALIITAAATTIVNVGNEVVTQLTAVVARLSL